MSFLDDKTVKIEVTRISGRKPRYQAWSVDGKAWIEEDGEKKFERDLSFNVLKDDAQFELCEDGCPTVVSRMKEKYEDILREDNVFKETFSQSLESEKSKVNDVEGSKYIL